MEAMEQTSPHYQSLQVLVQACGRLNIETRVCRISIDEMRNVVAMLRDTIPSVALQVPDDLVPKIRDHLFQVYVEELRKNPNVQFGTLFANHLDPVPVLREGYGIQIVDDRWFAEEENKPATEKFVQIVQHLYEARRGRPKRERAARHDALLIRWVDQERRSSNPRTWVVTLDQSLPRYRQVGFDGPLQSVAVSLDALLQWISPIAIDTSDDEETLAKIYAEAVRESLLPQDAFFDLQDFLVLAELEWSCRELPAADVEQCVRYLKDSAPSLDPRNPADRERLQHQLRKFFVDPSRQYKQELERREIQLTEVTKQAERQVQALTDELRQKDVALAQVQQEHAEQNERARDRRTGAVRLGIAALMAMVGIVIIAFGPQAAGFSWLLTHPNFLGLEGSLVAIWLAVCWTVAAPRHRNQASWAAIVALLAVVLQIVSRHEQPVPTPQPPESAATPTLESTSTP